MKKKKINENERHGNNNLSFRVGFCWVFITPAVSVAKHGVSARLPPPFSSKQKKKKKPTVLNRLGQPGRNVVLCNTDCWCDEKKVLIILAFMHACVYVCVRARVRVCQI